MLKGLFNSIFKRPKIAPNPDEMPVSMPSPAELKERRKPVFNVDQKEVTPQDNERVRDWAREIMQKHKSKLDLTKWKNREIITSGTVEPEAVDVKSIYPFPDLYWYIYRGGDQVALGPYIKAENCFSIMLISKKGGNTPKLLFTSTWMDL